MKNDVGAEPVACGVASVIQEQVGEAEWSGLNCAWTIEASAEQKRKKKKKEKKKWGRERKTGRRGGVGGELGERRGREGAPAQE